MRPRKSHCPQGHRYAGENLVEWQRRRGKRACLSCNRARARISARAKLGLPVLTLDETLAEVMRDYPEMAEAARS